MMLRFLICALAVIASLKAISQNPAYYNHKNFGTYFEEFHEEKDLIDFLQVKKGDVIADIGAGDGFFTSALTLLYDSVTIYVEDISPKTLKEKRLKKYAARFAKLKGGVQTNTFHVRIGTFSSTNLPDKAFDKIILLASFHEFTNMSAMVNDIAGKLKDDGKVYIMEAFSLPGDTIYCADKHKGYSIDQVTQIMRRSGLFLTKMRSPEGKIVDYSNCLVFEKNEAKSLRFYKTKDSLEPFVNLSRKLGTLAVAGDKDRIKYLGDSLKPLVAYVQTVYSTYEGWLRSIGNKSMMKQKFTYAINVFELVCSLYPLNANNFFVLARAQQAHGAYTEARDNYKKALDIDPLNSEAKKQYSLLSLGINQR